MLKRISMIALVAIGLTACNEDDDAGTQPSVVLPYFHKIVVQNNVQVLLAHGQSQQVSFSGSGNLAGVQQTVTNEVLTLNNNGSGASEVVITIVHPDIDSVGVQNNGKLEFANDFSTSAGHINITGYDAAEIFNGYAMNVALVNIELRNAGKMALTNIIAEQMNLRLTDGTRCNISGSARIQHIDMDNGCRYNIDFPQAGWDVVSPAVSDSCWITADNGARGWVYPTLLLDAEVSTGSEVFYKGTPDQIIDEISNGGALTPKEN